MISPADREVLEQLVGSATFERGSGYAERWQRSATGRGTRAAPGWWARSKVAPPVPTWPRSSSPGPPRRDWTASGPPAPARSGSTASTPSPCSWPTTPRIRRPPPAAGPHPGSRRGLPPARQTGRPMGRPGRSPVRGVPSPTVPTTGPCLSRRCSPPTTGTGTRAATAGDTEPPGIALQFDLTLGCVPGPSLGSDRPGHPGPPGAARAERQLGEEWDLVVEPRLLLLRPSPFGPVRRAACPGQGAAGPEPALVGGEPLGASRRGGPARGHRQPPALGPAWRGPGPRPSPRPGGTPRPAGHPVVRRRSR